MPTVSPTYSPTLNPTTLSTNAASKSQSVESESTLVIVGVIMAGLLVISISVAIILRKKKSSEARNVVRKDVQQLSFSNPVYSVHDNKNTTTRNEGILADSSAPAQQTQNGHDLQENPTYQDGLGVEETSYAHLPTMEVHDDGVLGSHSAYEDTVESKESSTHRSLEDQAGYSEPPGSEINANAAASSGHLANIENYRDPIEEAAYAYPPSEGTNIENYEDPTEEKAYAYPSSEGEHFNDDVGDPDPDTDFERDLVSKYQ